MIVFRNLVLATAIAAGSTLLSPQQVNAFELTGAWATSADQCSKVFARKGRAKPGQFREFLRRVRRRVHRGNRSPERQVRELPVKSRKESGQTINLVVACASGIMLSNVQFS